MADNNVIKFRRIEKKPEKTSPRPGQGPGRKGPPMPANRLSLIGWAAIIGAAIVIVTVQQSGLLGG